MLRSPTTLSRGLGAVVAAAAAAGDEEEEEEESAADAGTEAVDVVTEDGDETGVEAEEDGEGEGAGEGEEGEEKYFTNAERGATSVNLGWPSQPNGERKRDGDELLRPPSPCGY